MPRQGVARTTLIALRRLTYEVPISISRGRAVTFVRGAFSFRGYCAGFPWSRIVLAVTPRPLSLCCSGRHPCREVVLSFVRSCAWPIGRSSFNSIRFMYPRSGPFRHVLSVDEPQFLMARLDDVAPVPLSPPLPCFRRCTSIAARSPARTTYHEAVSCSSQLNLFLSFCVSSP